MLLRIATTHRPATDLGYLLHKNPARPQSFDLAFGKAHIFYPEVSEERCEAALLLEVDPIGLVRGPGSMLSDYVNDRPYVSSSFLCVAIARVLGTALSGRSKERPELANTPIPLEARLAAVPCRGQEDLVQRLFEPLGYELSADAGENPGPRPLYHNVTLRATTRLSDLLAHIYVLLPVLDNRKHYWIGEAELKKLLARGAGWLDKHPDRDMIVHRYLGQRRGLTTEALSQLNEAGAAMEKENTSAEETAETTEKGPPTRRLHDLRLDWAAEALHEAGARRIVDVGCGEGQLIRRLLADPDVTEVVGADPSVRALEIAARRLKLKHATEHERTRVRLHQSGLTYRDQSLCGYDAAAVIEVIEHIDPDRLHAFENAVFGTMAPPTIVLTTPNREHNVRYDNLAANGLRQRDHRFEWTRAEFEEWAKGCATRHGYDVETGGIGPEDPEVGASSQRGLFTRCQ